MKNSIVKQWWFWLISVILALGIGFGVFYFMNTNDSEDRSSEKADKKDKKKDEEESDNPFIGTWYLPASEGIITIEFKANGKCSFGQNDSVVNCSYEYDDEELTITNEDFEAEPIMSEYSVGKDYIEFVGEKMYKKKSKAEKDMKNIYKTEDNNKSNSDSSTTKKKIGLGDTFEFDGLEITVGKSYSFDVVDNEYSEYHGKATVVLPLTIKNKMIENYSLNMFYTEVTGSTGEVAKKVDIYFNNNVDWADPLKPGESYTKNMYFLYDGDGKYIVEFDNHTEIYDLDFNVKK